MMNLGMKAVTRKYITENIRDIGWKKWKLTREDLGIFAADRAQLYFRNKVYDVGIEELPTLMEKGTDLLVIEKEGVAEVLAPYAEKDGIAILNTRGFLTDYAQKLTRLSQHVAILSDFDDSGLLLARDIPNIPRIGIDFETLDYDFNPKLIRQNIEEDYDKPIHKRNHFTNLQELSKQGKLDRKIESWLPYIRNKRIEIDSVLGEVDNEKFWNFCLDKLNTLWKSRDYNRAVNIPYDVIPAQVEEFIEALKEKCNKLTKDKRVEIESTLGRFEGFISDIESCEKSLEHQIKEALSEDILVKSIIIKIQDAKQLVNGAEI